MDKNFPQMDENESTKSAKNGDGSSTISAFDGSNSSRMEHAAPQTGPPDAGGHQATKDTGLVPFGSPLVWTRRFRYEGGFQGSPEPSGLQKGIFSSIQSMQKTKFDMGDHGEDPP